jgi:hypothetical protein
MMRKDFSHMESDHPIEYIKIAVLDSGVESQIVCSILDDRGIPYFARSYHDTAYDGLFQVQKGWGEVCAPVENKDEILEILNDLRNKTAPEISMQD